MTLQQTVEIKRRGKSRTGQWSHVTTGIGRLSTVFVNLYVVDLADGGFVLVDTGLPRFARRVRNAIESRYGVGSRPQAIVLTHGHFDHAGNAKALADEWKVPIYAHLHELPYLAGHGDYPPGDPTPGGAISFLSRFFPTHGIDLGDRIRVLPYDGLIPEMPGWRWIHTPGHTAGHISLFRESDRALIAGDALATTDLDAWSSQFTWPRELSRPPTPLTPDWIAARQSIERLAELNPHTLAAGHGRPMREPRLSAKLRDFAADMREPIPSRYAGHPVRYAADGSVASVPPAVPDPLPRNLLLVGLVAALVTGACLEARRRSN